MAILLVGDREDVLLAKYQMLERNWRLDISQCYSFDKAEEMLSQAEFNCLIYVSPARQAQSKRLLQINKTYQIPVRIV